MWTAVIALTVVAPMLAPRADGSDSPKERYEALVTACKLAEDQWRERYPPGDEPILISQMKLREAKYREWPVWVFLPGLLALAEKYPDDPAATDALLWIVEKAMLVPIGDRGLYPSLKRALELMESRALYDDPRLFTVRRLSLSFQYPSPASEHFLRVASEKAKDRGQRGQFALALAVLLMNRSYLARNPYFDQPKKNAHAAFMAGRLVPEYMDYIRKTGLGAATAEAETMLNRTIEEFGDVVVKGRGRETTLAELARGMLRQIRDLAIGRVGPEIEGEDLDGKRLKLSDFRGKVVVLSFWGSWCGPAIRMVPHERELVARLADRPFVLLGVDGDADRDRAKRVVERERMSWRSWFDGEPGGPIAERWQVAACPTFYVLDAQGVIRDKLPGDAKALDKSVDDLLEEMKQAKAP
ncbi:MAG TPA: TlpA disulfide reductase family protein [Isosphaeraceae bacterium]|jgi:thiol-disulfide isomerase/thioredoxin|nr:TlpA disulfide reductase family protein [Isosphaeraceae bacterium]